jgi:hypothetical protein
MDNEKSVLTIATSKKIYVDMACNLAMSFLLWNDKSSIKFFLVTDSPQFIPQKLKQKINIIQIAEGEAGKGFSSKLSIDRFSQSNQTLFIDADCLVYGNLNPVFDSFKGHQVSVIGDNRYNGKNVGFCKDIEEVMANTGIQYFPLLCGSIYYFLKGEITTRIFNHARSLLGSYSDIGLVELRNKENEEPLMAIAMSKFDQNPIKDTGLIKADRMFYEFLHTNVLSGKAKLWNDKNIPVPEYSTLILSRPLIVHFNASHTESFEYQSEVIRLRNFFLLNWSRNTTNFYVYLTVIIPGKVIIMVKKTFRPLFNVLFGYRKITESKRI